MKTLIAVCALALCVSAGAVTLEEIDAQVVVVAAAQSGLDSLRSRQCAEAIDVSAVDTTTALTRARVTVELMTPLASNGLRDPKYVDVDLATLYATWDAITQRGWALTVRESGLDVRTITPGRYGMLASEARPFLVLLKSSITPTEEVSR